MPTAAKLMMMVMASCSHSAESAMSAGIAPMTMSAVDGT